MSPGVLARGSVLCIYLFYDLCQRQEMGLTVTPVPRVYSPKGAEATAPLRSGRSEGGAATGGDRKGWGVGGGPA